MSSSGDQNDLPPQHSLDVLKQAVREGHVRTTDLDLPGGSIVWALERRGLVTKSIRAFASDGSLLASEEQKNSILRRFQIIEPTKAGRDLVETLGRKSCTGDTIDGA